MEPSTIEVHDLSYYYPSKKALESVTFTLEKGSITALVGPNGAGKSTLMRCLAGLDSPFSGRIMVGGIDVRETPRLAHTKIGYLSDDFGLYDDLSVRDTLHFMAGCHQLQGESRINIVIDTLKLHSVATQKCSTLSRGWRQRVGIALAILHHPEVLILDEPASGLDPEARAELASILKTLQAEGMTILVSSHILAELEEYSTAMLVLRDGQIREHLTLATHQAHSIQSRTVMIHLAEPLTTEHETIITGISSEKVWIFPNRTSVQITVAGNHAAQHTILKKLVTENIPVCAFAVQEETLQNRYLEIAKSANIEKT